jgi:SAM-dependent methyltransferase
MVKERNASTAGSERVARPSLSDREAAANITVMHEIADKERAIQALTAELMQMKSSIAWRILRLPWRARPILAPPDSRRERLVQFLMNRLRTLKAKRPATQFTATDKETFSGQNRTIHDLTQGWDDERYFNLLMESVAHPYIEGIRMPGFPVDEIQRQFVGSTNVDALREGYNFYRYVKRYCGALGVPLNTDTTVLDFGCGWGRVSRFFFKDLDTKRFYGVDVDPEMIAFCASAMTCGSYSTVAPVPPTTFLDSSLDVIFAYSVFSHLAEPVALKWIQEFARILKPSGIVLATTQGKSLLDFCQSLRDRKDKLEFGWFEGLAQSFIPIEKAREDYDKGHYLYSSTGGGGLRDRSFYGEALISRKYIERRYTPFLTLRDFFDDPVRLPQVIFVMQKPSQNVRA